MKIKQSMKAQTVKQVHQSWLNFAKYFQLYFKQWSIIYLDHCHHKVRWCITHWYMLWLTTWNYRSEKSGWNMTRPTIVFGDLPLPIRGNPWAVGSGFILWDRFEMHRYTDCSFNHVNIFFSQRRVRFSPKLDKKKTGYLYHFLPCHRSMLLYDCWMTVLALFGRDSWWKEWCDP